MKGDHSVLNLSSTRRSIAQSTDGLAKIVNSVLQCFRFTSVPSAAGSEYDRRQDRRPDEGRPGTEVTPAGVDSQLRSCLGNAFSYLSEDSLRSLRTQVVWARVRASVSDSCDASPAFSGAKALEVELRRHLVTPQFLTALRTDLERDLFPPEVQDRLNGFLRDVRADQPTLGQCVGLLRVLARFRTINRNAVDLCASGAYLRSLAGGYGLLDPRFLKDLQHIVDRYRNPAAHGAISPGDSAEFERLLFGEAADGLLPFLLLAARPRTVLPGEAS